jgi:peroxiredoxin
MTKGAFMKNLLSAISLAALSVAFAPAASAAVAAGQPAAEFALTDVNGESHKLSDFRGKYVVLEWFNSDCPFVQKHYGTGNMQGLQSKYTAEGVIWLAINSTNPGHGDYKSPARSQAILKEWKAAPTALMLDPDGKVGQLYGAKTTPHMWVIDPNGVVIYAGGIDDKRSANPADVKTANNFVAAALDQAKAGKPVSVASAPPYGCSVKY